jgi:hypothetical protein
MPRKDGKPTVAEKKYAEKVEANRRFFEELTDEELTTLVKQASFGPWVIDLSDEPELIEQVRVEREKRGLLNPEQSPAR